MPISIQHLQFPSISEVTSKDLTGSQMTMKDESKDIYGTLKSLKLQAV